MFWVGTAPSIMLSLTWTVHAFKSHVKVNPVVLFCPKSHAGKVVLRSWYEKNKHIFPASRWEPYDPEKKWDKYTVGVILLDVDMLHLLLNYSVFFRDHSSFI